MTAYAVGILHDLQAHRDIVEYLERIDATLEPFNGRFVVHGADPVVREGVFDARFVVIEFPDIDAANRWYDSPDYQAIIPLRAKHTKSITFIVDGIDGSHAATDVLTRASTSASTPIDRAL